MKRLGLLGVWGFRFKPGAPCIWGYRVIASIPASTLAVHLSCCDHNECRSQVSIPVPLALPSLYHTLHLRRQLAHHPCRWTLGSDNIASSAELSGMTDGSTCGIGERSCRIPNSPKHQSLKAIRRPAAAAARQRAAPAGSLQALPAAGLRGLGVFLFWDLGQSF